MASDSFAQYWIGRNIDYDAVWEDLEAGTGYINKFRANEVYLLRLRFQKYELGWPLFNHQAIYKTVKGVFHDLKRENFSPEEYNSFAPIYLYELKRGSEEWWWLAQLKPLLLFLQSAREYIGLRKDKAETQLADWEIAKIKNEILIAHPDASQRDKEDLVNAKTTPEINKALKNLNNQGLKKAAISEKPFNGKSDTADVKMLETDKLFE